MNRTEARLRWHRVAAGDLERGRYDRIDLYEWIREVAAAVLLADKARPVDRPGALLEALGLKGKEDPYDELREFMSKLTMFFVDGDGVLQDLEEPMVIDFRCAVVVVPSAKYPQGVPVSEKIIELKPGPLIGQLVEAARERGLLSGVYAVDDKKARELVRKMLT